MTRQPPSSIVFEPLLYLHSPGDFVGQGVPHNLSTVPRRATARHYSCSCHFSSRWSRFFRFSNSALTVVRPMSIPIVSPTVTGFVRHTKSTPLPSAMSVKMLLPIETICTSKRTSLMTSFKFESSIGILFERVRWDRHGEWPNLQGRVFCDRVNPIGVCAQGEELL